MLKILALTVKPDLSPDTRYRILQYLELFQGAGIAVRHLSLLNRRYHEMTMRKGQPFLKVVLYVWAWVKRMVQLLALAPRFDAVWVLRELSPVGPPLLERLLFRLHPRVILDIDDAIFIPDEASDGFIHHHLRDFTKFKKTAHRYHTVVCGNRYLAAYFRSLDASVETVPTVVRLEPYAAVRRTPSPRPRLGWIGTPTNRIHFKIIEAPVRQLAQKLDFELIVVGLTEKLNWPTANVRYLSWKLSAELDYFGLFDIGLMPLLDHEFARGKCAFKIIQYMAAGLPVVASPVGANIDVVQHGVNGFLAGTEDEWERSLQRLLTDRGLREEMGLRGRQTVREQYSLEIWWKPYAHIFKKDLDNG